MVYKNVLLKIYPQLNFGDDLFLKITLEKFPQTRFYVLCDSNMYKSFSKKYENLVLIDVMQYLSIIDRFLYRVSFSLGYKWLQKKVYTKTLSKQYNLSNITYDSFLLVGGSMFMEKSSQSSRRLIWFYEWVNQKFNGKPKYYLGCNFGPYVNDTFLINFEKIFSEASEITFREDFSKLMFSSLKNINVYPDIVFGYVPKKEEVIKGSVGIVLVNPITKIDNLSFDYELFIKKIVQIIEALVAKKKTITFFSFCENEKDSELYIDIRDLLPDNLKSEVSIVKYNGEIDDFIKAYSKIESCICSRFHGIILSLLFGQDIIPISYSKKIDNMLLELGFPCNVVNIADINEIDTTHLLESSTRFSIPKEVIEKSSLHFKEFGKF